jgi:hypothetical protein
LISHPSATVALQSAKPELQEPMAHFDETQAGVAFGVAQTSAQRLQLFTSLVVLTSQPSAGLFEQCALPAGQFVTVHTPPWQTSVAVVLLHTFPQDPQLFGSCWVSISQPFAAFLSQSAKPEVHIETAHVEVEHVSTTLAVLQGVPHAPQWPALVVRFTHAAPAPPSGGQSVGKPPSAAQFIPHAVPLHVELPPAGMGQTLHELVPHELVDVFCRHVAALPVPQLCVPVGHTQLPPWHIVPPVHAWPHAPQLVWLVERS